jgi:DNA-binding FadR family transcriptional regulator
MNSRRSPQEFAVVTYAQTFTPLGNSMASPSASNIARLRRSAAPRPHSADANAPTVETDGRNSASVAERPYQRLANEVVQVIIGGELEANDRLPSERILAERFGVSRTSIREAIIALEIRGIVEVRGGSGIYVRTLKPTSAPAEASTGPFELLRGRLIIEPQICAAAATAAKDSDLDAVYVTIVHMIETIGDKRANELADRAFHVAIATATGNGMLAQIVASVWDRRRGEMWEKIEEHFHTTALREAAIEDHQNIFKALVARDPVAASDQMRKHIERVIHEFGKAW